MSEKNGAQSQSVLYTYTYDIYITVLGRTLSIYFLNYLKSETFYRDGPSIRNVSLVGTQQCYIFKIGEQFL